MIVAWDEEFASVKLYHNVKDVGVKPYEVIPIEDLLDAWEKQKAEQTEPQTCDTCRYDKEPWYRQVCDECTVGESNWKPKTEPQTERPCNKCEWYQKYGKCVFGYCHYEYEQAHKDEPQTEKERASK